ncbi:four-carbon acid sugar kinase family protein [Streptomyces pathocidini]|uniref:Four-carbon acid sugar kinase family protein n=2 Tax=Streptomyces pathocidini TaxID=1650571 RepID=A0ABW7UYH7_9ACTN
MPTPIHRRLLALADDLSGAAETAATLLSPGRRCRVVLGPVGSNEAESAPCWGPLHNAVAPADGGLTIGGTSAAEEPSVQPPRADAESVTDSASADGTSATRAPLLHSASPTGAALTDGGPATRTVPAEGELTGGTAPVGGEPTAGAVITSTANMTRAPEAGRWGDGAVAPKRAPEPMDVIDLDSRYLPAAVAAGRVRDALPAVGEGTLVLKKFDSLLRGNLAAETGALAEGGAGVVVAPALPAAGRVVRGGVVHVRGVPLHETDAWRAEAVRPPRSVAEALAPHPVTLVPLTAVRGAREALTARLRKVAASGDLAVCDAETDTDLDAIAAAALALSPPIRLAGSGGLAAAVGRQLTAAGDPVPLGPGHRGGSALREDGAPPPLTHAQLAPTRRPPPGSSTMPGQRPVLVVVGTAEPSAAEQIRRLVHDGAVHFAVPVAELTEPGLRLLLPQAQAAAVTIVSIAADSPRLPPSADGGAGADSSAGGGADTDDGTDGSAGADGASGTAAAAPLASAGAGPGAQPAPRAGGSGTGPGALRGSPRRLTRHLADAVARALARPGATWSGPGPGAVAPPHLVLTGGETARCVLDAVGISEVETVGQVHYGAVVSVAPDGRFVVTRPGSYGDGESLRQIVRALIGTHREPEPEADRRSLPTPN